MFDEQVGKNEASKTVQVAASVELLKPRVFEVPLEDLFDGNALDPGARCCIC